MREKHCWLTEKVRLIRQANKALIFFFSFGKTFGFCSLSIPKTFRFCFIILQNGTKHHENFLAKRWLFSILDFGLKRSKSPKEPQEVLMRAINSAF